MSIDVEAVRKDFPILSRQVHGRPLVYLDNAATTQKPRAVIDALVNYYENYNANIHRGMYTIAIEATDAHEEARAKVARLIKSPAGAKSIVFTRNATEALNLVANAWGRKNLHEGDEIVLSVIEHHSNLVPWQLIAREKGAVLRFIDIDQDGRLRRDQLKQLIGPKTKVVSLVHASNVLGINPVREAADLAHQYGAIMVVDGAQSVPNMPVDVTELGCDFLAFSGHKMMGPTGIGVLWGKPELLEAMDPFLGGGEMISRVTLEESTWNELPYKFEAGTPNIAGAIGLGAALDYIGSVGFDAIGRHERDLLDYGTAALAAVDGVRLIGTARRKASILSFVMDGVHPHDIGTIIDREGVAVRTGHHCAQPVMDRFGIPATARASLAMYNTKEDLDALADALEKVREVFN